MKTDGHDDDSLRGLLRHGDPAHDGSELSPSEATELRRVMLRSVRTSQSMRWIPLGAAVAAAVLAAIVFLPGQTLTPNHNKASGPTGSAPLALEESAEAKRQIQFATDQGTQIIWVLDPNLDL